MPYYSWGSILEDRYHNWNSELITILCTDCRHSQLLNCIGNLLLLYLLLETKIGLLISPNYRQKQKKNSPGESPRLFFVAVDETADYQSPLQSEQQNNYT